MTAHQLDRNLSRNDQHLEQEQSADPVTYPCTQCERIYARSSSLRKHVRRRHHSDNEKLKFVCIVCGKDFLFKNEFVQHEYQHTQERKHACDICGRRYTSASSLTQHMKTHDESKRFECFVCKRKFTRASSVKTHMIVHSSRREFFCSECPKSFQDQRGLNRHRDTHKKNELFECPLCGVFSCRRDNMRRHLRNMHPDQDEHSLFESIENRCRKATFENNLSTTAALSSPVVDTRNDDRDGAGNVPQSAVTPQSRLPDATNATSVIQFARSAVSPVAQNAPLQNHPFPSISQQPPVKLRRLSDANATVSMSAPETPISASSTVVLNTWNPAVHRPCPVARSAVSVDSEKPRRSPYDYGYNNDYDDYEYDDDDDTTSSEVASANPGVIGQQTDDDKPEPPQKAFVIPEIIITAASDEEDEPEASVSEISSIPTSSHPSSLNTAEARPLLNSPPLELSVGSGMPQFMRRTQNLWLRCRNAVHKLHRHIRNYTALHGGQSARLAPTARHLIMVLLNVKRPSARRTLRIMRRIRQTHQLFDETSTKATAVSLAYAQHVSRMTKRNVPHKSSLVKHARELRQRANRKRMVDQVRQHLNVSTVTTTNESSEPSMTEATEGNELQHEQLPHPIAITGAYPKQPRRNAGLPFLHLDDKTDLPPKAPAPAMPSPVDRDPNVSSLHSRIAQGLQSDTLPITPPQEASPARESSPPPPPPPSSPTCPIAETPTELVSEQSDEFSIAGPASSTPSSPSKTKPTSPSSDGSPGRRTRSAVLTKRPNMAVLRLAAAQSNLQHRIANHSLEASTEQPIAEVANTASTSGDIAAALPSKRKRQMQRRAPPVQPTPVNPMIVYSERSDVHVFVHYSDTNGTQPMVARIQVELPPDTLINNPPTAPPPAPPSAAPPAPPSAPPPPSALSGAPGPSKSPPPPPERPASSMSPASTEQPTTPPQNAMQMAEIPPAVRCESLDLRSKCELILVPKTVDTAALNNDIPNNGGDGPEENLDSPTYPELAEIDDLINERILRHKEDRIEEARRMNAAMEMESKIYTKSVAEKGEAPSPALKSTQTENKSNTEQNQMHWRKTVSKKYSSKEDDRNDNIDTPNKPISRVLFPL